MATVFDFKDESQVNAWIARSDELATQAYEAMRDTAQIIEEIKSESRGSLVDDLIHASNQVLDSAKKCTEVFEALSGAIKDVFSFLGKFADVVNGVFSGFTG